MTVVILLIALHAADQFWSEAEEGNFVFPFDCHWMFFDAVL